MQALVVLEPKLALVDALHGIDPPSTRVRVRRRTRLMLDGIRHADDRP